MWIGLKWTAEPGGQSRQKEGGTMTTGEKIRALREKAGLTQQQLGIACGLTVNSAQPNVAGWEQGVRPIPRKRIKVAAEALQVEISELI